jgi:hypothetical protein
MNNEIRSNTLTRLGLIATLAGSILATEHPAAAAEPSGGSQPLGDYYSVRRDVRRCAFPMCGGFFVKLVNQSATLCADGVRRAECYVTALDLAPLRLSDTDSAELTAEANRFLLKGKFQRRIFPRWGTFGHLVVNEAWEGHSNATATGRFLRLWDTGIRCITTPCPTVHGQLLNLARREFPVGTLDLSGISDDPTDAFEQLGEPAGVLVAATITPVAPATGGVGVDASEYYLPFPSGPQACGSRGLSPCYSGEFCNFPDTADCGRADRPGVCKPVPELCTQEFAPVCGCDGQTYGNACSAHAAGVSVDFEGPCEPEPVACGARLGNTCAAGEFCSFPPAAICGRADGTGVCEPRPILCTREYRPVCGCNGQTYGNACSANAAGVSVDSEGECPCPPNLECPVSSCILRPPTTGGFCPAVFNPVCGCDNNTYGNACEASRAGVPSFIPGPCGAD